MIRHRPDGRGHPYLVEPDQRVPVRPLAGAAVRAARDDAVGMTASVQRGARARRWQRPSFAATLRGAAMPEVVTDYGVTAPRAGEGHLTDAVARLGEQRGRSLLGWPMHPPLAAGQACAIAFCRGRSFLHTLVRVDRRANGKADSGELHVERDDATQLGERVRFPAASPGSPTAQRTYRLPLRASARTERAGHRLRRAFQRPRPARPASSISPSSISTKARAHAPTFPCRSRSPSGRELWLPHRHRPSDPLRRRRAATPT